MAIVNEVVTKFSFIGSLNPLSAFNKSTQSSIKFLGAFTAAAFGAAAAVLKLGSDTAQANDAIIQLSRVSGVSVDTMQELGFAASQSGSNIDAITGTIDSLTSKIGDAANMGSADFARLGISVRDVNGQVKTADTILLEVRDRFQALDVSLAQQRSLAGSLGIDPSLIQLLNSTDEELGSLAGTAKRYGVLSKANADILADVNNEQAKTSFLINAVKRDIAVGVAPAITELTSNFRDLLDGNREWIVDGAQAIVKIVGALTESFKRFIPILPELAIGFGVVTVATAGFGATIAAVTSPVVLTTLGIAAAVLIIDDLLAAMNGGQSVIADFFQEFFGVDIIPILGAIKDIFNELIPVVKVVAGVIADVFLAVFVNLNGVITAIVQLISGDFSGAFGTLKDVGDRTVNVLLGSFRALQGVFTGLLDRLKSIASVIPGIDFPTESELASLPGATAAAGPVAPAGVASSGDRTVTQDVEININAPNAAEAQRGVEEGLQVQLREAEDIMRRGTNG